MYGCKEARKKEVGKDSLKVEVPTIFVKGNYFGAPLCTMCWITRVTIRSDSEDKGRAGGGGGADTRRKGLKEDFMKSLAI